MPILEQKMDSAPLWSEFRFVKYFVIKTLVKFLSYRVTVGVSKVNQSIIFGVKNYSHECNVRR